MAQDTPAGALLQHQQNRRPPTVIHRDDEELIAIRKRNPMLAFCVGLPKSGTCTLQTAFMRSGVKSAHWHSYGIGYVGRLMYERYFRGQDPLLDFAEFRAVTQADLAIGEDNYWPQFDFGMLASLQQYHPECIFIMPYRKPEKIADSMIRWVDFQRRLTQRDIVGLPRGRGATRDELVIWIRARHAAIRRFFAGDDRYFEYDIEDPAAPDALGARLGLKIAWWGRANVNKRLPAADAPSP